MARADARALPFHAGQFDLICALGLLDYIEDSTPFFGEVRRLLRPTGVAVVTQPNGASVTRAVRERFRRWVRPARAASSSRGRTGREIESKFRQAGLRPLQVFHITYGIVLRDSPWTIRLSRSAERWIPNGARPWLAWSIVWVLERDEG